MSAGASKEKKIPVDRRDHTELFQETNISRNPETQPHVEWWFCKTDGD